MELKEALKLAVQSLWANKLRTVLTLLGVVIGVTSVIAVVTLINGANTYVATKFARYGGCRGRKVRTPQGSVPDNVRDAGFKARGRLVPQKTYRRCREASPKGCPAQW